MAKEEITVTMDICVRKPDGTIKCQANGFTAKYRKGQIGPHEVSISYPS